MSIIIFRAAQLWRLGRTEKGTNVHKYYLNRLLSLLDLTGNIVNQVQH
jgi:hypothetical protein